MSSRGHQIVSKGLSDYGLFTTADAPTIHVGFVAGDDEGAGRGNAKELSDLSVLGVAPAYVSAVAQATGVRPESMPPPATYVGAQMTQR